MKLDIIFCRQCGCNHPPGEHKGRPRPAARRPGDPPPPPPPSSWGNGRPAPVKLPIPKAAIVPRPKGGGKKPKKAAPPVPTKRKAPDFVATDPSSTPPKPQSPHKKSAEYLGKMRLLMRQKRAAEREGITLDQYRAKYGESHMPARLRKPAKRKG